MLRLCVQDTFKQFFGHVTKLSATWLTTLSCDRALFHVTELCVTWLSSMSREWALCNLNELTWLCSVPRAWALCHVTKLYSISIYWALCNLSELCVMCLSFCFTCLSSKWLSTLSLDWALCHVTELNAKLLSSLALDWVKFLVTELCVTQRFNSLYLGIILRGQVHLIHVDRLRLSLPDKTLWIHAENRLPVHNFAMDCLRFLYSFSPLSCICSGVRQI